MLRISDLDGKTMTVSDFLSKAEEIPFWAIYVGNLKIDLMVLADEYGSRNVYMYNDPKDFGVDETGNSHSFDRLFVEVV